MSSDTLPATVEPSAASGWMIGIVSGCGIASIALLAAALVYAHHWGAVADAIVTGWAAATLTSAAGVRLLTHRRAAAAGSPFASPVPP
ncbi:MAG: hypothetical protein ACRDQE_02955 [Gaiellales bacterium]